MSWSRNAVVLYDCLVLHLECIPGGLLTLLREEQNGLSVGGRVHLVCMPLFNLGRADKFCGSHSSKNSLLFNGYERMGLSTAQRVSQFYRRSSIIEI